VAAGLTSAAPALGTWQPLARVPGIVDVNWSSAGRAARPGVPLRAPPVPTGTAPVPFARGPQGYAGSTGEPYLTLGTGHSVPGATCSFGRGDVFVLNPGAAPGVLRVDGGGRSHPFATLPAGAFPSGHRNRQRRLVRVLAAGDSDSKWHDNAPRARLPRARSYRRRRRSTGRGRARGRAIFVRPLRGLAHCCRRGQRSDLRVRAGRPGASSRELPPSGPGRRWRRGGWLCATRARATRHCVSLRSGRARLAN